MNQKFEIGARVKSSANDACVYVVTFYENSRYQLKLVERDGVTVDCEKIYDDVIGSLLYRVD